MIDRRTGVRNDPAFILAFMFVCGFFGIAFMVILKDIPKESQNIVQQLIAIVSMIMSAMAGYFYGQTKIGKDAQEASDVRKDKVDAVITDLAKSAASTPQIQGTTDVKAKEMP